VTGAGLLVRVEPAPDGEVEELAELTELLRAELLELDVDSVELLAGQVAPGRAKGLGAVLGWLAIRFGTAEGLRAALSTVRRWVSRTGRSVEVSIDGDVLRLTGVSSQQQDRIIAAWVARHGGGG
jgi:hypothetical protein